jgi:hypothetical protein
LNGCTLIWIQYKKDDGTYVSNGGGWFTHKLTGRTFKH